MANGWLIFVEKIHRLQVLLMLIMRRGLYTGEILSKLLGKLEDLKVLRRSPDLLNNVKIGQGQLQLIKKQILFYHILGLQPFWSSDLTNPMNTPSKPQ